MRRFVSVVSVAAIISIFLVGCGGEPVLPEGTYEGCVVAMQEWVGGPVSYQQEGTPNGVIQFTDEPCETFHSWATGQTVGIMANQVQVPGATVETYEVQGCTKEQVKDDIFGQNGKGPMGPTGVRYAGRTVSSYYPDVTSTQNPETKNWEIHIANLTWNITVLLPHWTQPPNCPEADKQAVEEFIKEVVKHEEGHVNIFQTEMANVRNAVVCHTEVVAPGQTPQDTNDNIRQAVENYIEKTPQYKQMEQAQANYDAPHNAQTNPTGTNHGTENNQNAVLCHPG